MLHDLGLIDEVPSWYSPAKPKPVYESDDMQAYWDVPVFGNHEELSVGQKQREEERREDRKVCPPPPPVGN
ncbi:unnamed protein product [Porites lobata]|uniref:Uncharacterized protein n=1 Tax=Porites lobata TaxID=104759 RepID=A0ABN8QTY8_9CNID|nr:unnamed protein product [Porites lobata]